METFINNTYFLQLMVNLFSKQSLPGLALLYLLASSGCKDCTNEPQEELQQKPSITTSAPEIEEEPQPVAVPPVVSPLETVLNNISSSPELVFTYSCTNFFIQNHYQEALPVWNEFLRATALVQDALVSTPPTEHTPDEREELVLARTIITLPAMMYSLAYNYYRQLGDSHDLAVQRAVPLSTLVGEPLSPEMSNSLSELINIQGSARDLFVAYVFQAQIYVHFIQLQDMVEFSARLGINEITCPYQRGSRLLGDWTREAYISNFETADGQTNLDIVQRVLVENMEERRQVLNSIHINPPQ